jgi:ribose transport system permease protein
MGKAGSMKLKENIKEKFLKSTAASYGSVIIAIVILSAIWLVTSPYFLTMTNFRNIGVYMSAAGIIAAGVTVSMLLGGLDLSQMAIMAFSGIVVGVAFTAGVRGPVLMLIAILTGLIGGLCNGCIMNFLGIDPIITTLGTQLIFRSLAFMISDGNMITVRDDFIIWIGRGRILGIPVMLWFMVVVYVIIGIVLKYTKFGRNVISVGGSPEASYLSGINVKKTRAIAFMISGSCAGLSTLLYIAQGYVAQPNQGSGAEMDCIAAVVIGGLSIKGGRGSVIGTLLGMLFFSILANGMGLLSMDSYAQILVKGVVLLAAVYIDIARSKKNK